MNARLLRQLDLLILEEDLPGVLEYCTFPGGKVRAQALACERYMRARLYL